MLFDRVVARVAERITRPPEPPRITAEHTPVCGRCGEPWPYEHWQENRVKLLVGAAIADGTYGMSMAPSSVPMLIGKDGARLPLLDPFVTEQLRASGWEPVLNADGMLIGFEVNL